MAGFRGAFWRRFTVDLDRLADLPARQGGPLARYASTIRQHRGDHGGTVLTIREQDLQSLAVISQEYAAALGQRLRAVRRQRGMTLKQVQEQPRGASTSPWRSSAPTNVLTARSP